MGQNASGPGVFAPEANGFITGVPLAPNTPYDLFSSTPQVSGNAGIAELLSTATLATAKFTFSLSGGLETVHGSTTNATYWGENLLPTLNPHLGSPALPYAVAFPSHPGQDDGTATRLSLLSGSAATADGKLTLHAGWFDLSQTDRFVFAQPALTSENPAIAYAPPETLSSGLPTLDSWQPLSSALQLHGLDLVAKNGIATLEMTDADLPSLPGDSAHLAMASIVVDHGEGTRFSGQVLHATTAGTPFVTAASFGAAPQFTLYPQGVASTSTLSGQEQTVAGVRGAFHILPVLGLDGVAEIGHSWYAASLAAQPGTTTPSDFYHTGFIETHGHVSGSLDLYRVEPGYATMILPYGIPENTWGATFAWPGQWFKSNYQLIDNTVLADNRQGYRLRLSVDKAPVEVHLEYTGLHQIDAVTTTSSQRLGFADPYFLPQQPGAATFGQQKRSALWTAWHLPYGDLSLDIVDDALHRPFVATHPEDAISYEAPQAVVTFARHLSADVIGSIGVGRFAVKGTFDEPVDFAQRLFFVGFEAAQTPHSSLLVSFRRSSAAGQTTAPLVPGSPNFAASTLIVEQRLHL